MHRTLFVLAAVTWAGCTTVRAPTGTVVFQGMCDASGAVVLDDGRFAVADDEENLLRIYDSRRGGPPVRTVDLSDSLELQRGKRKYPEIDIEAATQLGSLSFWLISHGRRSSGKRDESRFRFFATEIRGDGAEVRVVGKPSSRLLEDLLAAPQLAPYALAAASQLPPKEPGGLNIEGMTAMEDGRSVLIGFRNPVPEGKALLVPLLNPAEVVQGAPARFGEVRRFDLGGRGIRALSWWRGRYLLIGGGVDGTGTSQLFEWRSDQDQPSRVHSVDFTGFNPEGFVSPEESEDLLVLSDDGSVRVDGTECKRQKDPARKAFRGLWIRLPAPSRSK
ncbi:MAG: DUF3616 domain-containing protein [Myxococcaceae bacterium]